MTIKLEDMIHDSAPENKNKIRGSRLKITRTDNNGNTTEKQRNGYMMQGEEMVFLNAPEIYFPEDAPLSTEKRELYDILNELFQGGEEGGDVFHVSGSGSGITVTMVKNRSETQELTAEFFTFKTKTYKTITTLKSGKTTIEKTWSKTIITEVLKDGGAVWKFTLDSSGTVTGVLDSAGNDVLNGVTGADGLSVITSTPEGIALGWALAYNNEQTNALQKALDAYQDGVDDCDKINEAEGVGGNGEGDGDGTGGDGTGGDGTGGSGGIKLPDKNYAAIELPEGKGAVGCYKSYNSSGKLTSYAYWYAGSIIVTQNSNGTHTAKYKDGAILTSYYLNIYGEYRESIVRYSSFSNSGINIEDWEYYGDVTYE